jgi:hypothetical protein
MVTLSIETKIIVEQHSWLHNIDCLEVIAAHVVLGDQETRLVSVVASADADVQLAVSKVGVS